MKEFYRILKKAFNEFEIVYKFKIFKKINKIKLKKSNDFQIIQICKK